MVVVGKVFFKEAKTKVKHKAETNPFKVKLVFAKDLKSIK